MSRIKDSLHSNLLNMAIAVLLLIVIIIELFQIEDSYEVGTLLLIVSLFVVRPLPCRQWTFLDWVLCIIVLWDVVSCFYSSCTLPAVRALLTSISGFTAYLLLRRLLSDIRFVQTLLTGSYLPLGVALLLAVCSFFVFRSSVLESGFTDTYHFRFLFRPLGYMTNVWAEVLLILLGWICLLRRYAFAFIFLTTFAVLLSFSRGAYIAMGIYWTVWLISVSITRKIWKPWLAVLAATVIVAISFPSEMKTTLRMNATVSQQRSTEWRVDATRSAWEVVKEHPTIGYGNGNYTYAVDRAMNQDSTLSFTALAPNIVMKLLIEKGVIGIIPYLLLVIGICRLTWRNRKETQTWVIIATLLAVAAKEITQSTLFNAPFIWLMTYILLAFLHSKYTEKETLKQKTSALKYIIPSLVLIAYGCGVLFCQLATRGYCLPGNKTPLLVQSGMEYTKNYVKTNEKSYVEKAIHSFKEAKKYNPEDIQITYLLARTYLLSEETIEQGCFLLEQLVSEFPRNALYSWTLGNTYYREGSMDKALTCLADAIYLIPRLTTMPEIKEWENNDPAFFQSFRERLYVYPQENLHEPSDWARYGYIMHWLGDYPLAEKALRKAVTDLPNLATPWRLLGEERKYRLLQLGAFKKNLFSVALPNELVLTDELLLDIAYKGKFYDWYGRLL